MKLQINAEILRQNEGVIRRLSYYYINTNEIPGELSRENMISSHVNMPSSQVNITVAMAT